LWDETTHAHTHDSQVNVSLLDSSAAGPVELLSLCAIEKMKEAARLSKDVTVTVGVNASNGSVTRMVPLKRAS
jgi:hypothetical protein